MICIAAVLVALGFVHQRGYQHGFTQAETEGKAALATLQADYTRQAQQQAERDNAALVALQQSYQQRVQAANDAEREYLTTTDALRTQNENLKRKIDDVTQLWIDARGQAHPVQCVFTAGFVQQYNAAFGIAAGTGIAAPTGGSGDQTTTAGPVDRWLRDSGVTQRDILAHSIDTGERYQQLVAQINGLLDYIKALQNRKEK
ncbi:Lipoprotein, phage-associated [Dickeya dianthicola RNS04.9]|nr:Lipoprotein, phage-associated [Dickeya dianthicola RNS04.9]